MIRRLQAKLTYANVTATVALFVALGGTSYALTLPRNSVGDRQIRPGAVRSSEVRDRSLRLRDISVTTRDQLKGGVGPAGPAGPTGAAAAKYFAVAQAGGRFVRGNATSGGHETAPGSYSVGFAESVSGCAYSATLGTSDGSAAPAGRITVNDLGGRVGVQTFDVAGNPADVPFHLVVAC